MAGLKGYSRRPRAGDPRERRNADSLTDDVQFRASGEIIALNDKGELTLKLKSDGGLENASG
ncbi:hypothetical protein, partial [Tritonibacter sp. SIMBA_163]|uniref:hypothetical protein n=1 Tax=Tritonibacter sp. SIMBA_163 TaxID=3080868 RepID=UPI0039812869